MFLWSNGDESRFLVARMRSWILIVVKVVIILFVGTCESVLTVYPQNTVAVTGGGQIVLTCTSSIASTQISWTFTATGATLVSGCAVVGSNPQYSVSSPSGGICNLILNSPMTTALAGLYRCTETSSGNTGTAQLIILGEIRLVTYWLAAICESKICCVL